jgi:hypothetical protein
LAFAEKMFVLLKVDLQQDILEEVGTLREDGNNSRREN